MQPLCSLNIMYHHVFTCQCSCESLDGGIECSECVGHLGDMWVRAFSFWVMHWVTTQTILLAPVNSCSNDAHFPFICVCVFPSLWSCSSSPLWEPLLHTCKVIRRYLLMLETDIRTAAFSRRLSCRQFFSLKTRQATLQRLCDSASEKRPIWTFSWGWVWNEKGNKYSHFTLEILSGDLNSFNPCRSVQIIIYAIDKIPFRLTAHWPFSIFIAFMLVCVCACVCVYLF